MGVSTTGSIIRSFISSAPVYGPGNVLNMGHTNSTQYILFPEEFKVWKFLTFLKSLNGFPSYSVPFWWTFGLFPTSVITNHPE